MQGVGRPTMAGVLPKDRSPQAAGDNAQDTAACAAVGSERRPTRWRLAGLLKRRRLRLATVSGKATTARPVCTEPLVVGQQPPAIAVQAAPQDGPTGARRHPRPPARVERRLVEPIAAAPRRRPRPYSTGATQRVAVFCATLRQTMASKPLAKVAATPPPAAGLTAAREGASPEGLRPSASHVVPRTATINAAMPVLRPVTSFRPEQATVSGRQRAG